MCALSVLLLALSGAHGHSGGLDRYGCHAGSQPYHCHDGGRSSRPTSTSTPRSQSCASYVRQISSLQDANRALLQENAALMTTAETLQSAQRATEEKVLRRTFFCSVLGFIVGIFLANRGRTRPAR